MGPTEFLEELTRNCERKALELPTGKLSQEGLRGKVASTLAPPEHDLEAASCTSRRAKGQAEAGRGKLL